MTWVEDVQNMLNNVTYDDYDLPTLRPIPSIYKVPDFLRNMNHQAYTPQLISIGPFHYGSQKLQFMEKIKKQCFKFFIEQHDVELNILATSVAEKEEEVRYSYAEDIPIQKEDFMKMILLDASFIIVLFLKNWNQNYTAPIKIQPWMIARIQLDLILLENQLPFSFIEHLYDRFVYVYQSLCPSFMKLTFDYFDCFNTQKLPPNTSSLDVNHFADLLRHFYLLPKRGCRIRLERNMKVREMFCASKLAETGVKFKSSSTDCQLDKKYSSGVLIIPKFNLNNDTEICARNVVALEQCYYREDAYVTDYFFMLGFLIHARSDTDLLAQEGIIVKRPMDNIMATLSNDLCTNISSSNINKEYHNICEALTKFYSKRWYYVLGSTLRKDYFNTPWMGAASFGAIILLFFTLVQTVCNVLQTYKQFKNES